MTSSRSAAGDHDRWRDKYFTLNDELERTERDYQSYLNTLQRALVRVSLAADGQDETLDKQLATLRNLLRKAEPDKISISNVLTQVESALLRLESQRKQGGAEGGVVLQQLAEQLVTLDISREHKKTLKQYTKALKSQGQQLAAFPGLLAEYGRIQQQVFNDLSSPAGPRGSADQQLGIAQGSGGGFFARLFGKEEADVVVTAEPAPEPIGSPGSESASPVESAVPAQAGTESVMAASNESGQEPGSPPQSSNEIALSKPTQEESGAEVASAVIALRQSLADLLADLPVSSETAEEVRVLHDRLEQEAAAKLPDLLDEIATLVVALMVDSQAEFEGYLTALEQRLQEMTAFLSRYGESEADWRQVTQQHEQDMRQQMQGLSSEVAEATELSELKTSVQNHVDTLAETMDSLAATGSQREEALSQELAELKQQLQLLENETRTVKQQLKTQTLRALTDTLTCLPNREALEERLEMEWQRHLRYKNPTAIALLDIDHFKSVNDTYGHLVGDKVLQAVAKQLQQSVRKTDFVARYGGEEFMLLMPETNLAEAKIAAEKVREQIAALVMTSLPKGKNITVSMGIAGLKLGLSLAATIEQADQALYQAKEAGRNCVSLAGE